MSKTLVTLLTSNGIISPQQVMKALNGEVGISNNTLGQLIKQGEITEDSILENLARLYSLPIMEVTHIDQDAVNLVPQTAMAASKCLPFRMQRETVVVAVADPSRTQDLENFVALFQQPVAFVLTTFSNLNEAISRASTLQSEPPSLPESPIRPTVAPPRPAMSPESTQTNYRKSPVKVFGPKDLVVNMVNEILGEGVNRGASDIHIEAEAKNIRVRMRVDGQLIEVYQAPLEAKDQLISRIKIMGGLDISERRIPQDGRIKLNIGKGEYHFRLNMMPSMHGETAALRIVRPETSQLKLAEIGFSQDQLAAVHKGIHSPSGLVLLTGPTGCGKTTTIYSAIADINRGTEKIVTVEDPVEFSVAGITQVQVNKDTGLTFPTVLKALLRQDPDVILVGEIRDQETATIAVQAALSGHLVLSTIHTYDAASAILRLLNMGIEPFMVLTSVSTTIAQRLVRKICENCRVEVPVSQELLNMIGDDRGLFENTTFYKGSGCEKCFHIGYKGQTPIFEVLELNDAMKESILKGENPITFKRKAIESGMKTLRQSALELAVQGITNLEEALSSTLER